MSLFGNLVGKAVPYLIFLISSWYGIHWSLTTECLQSMHEMSVNIVVFDSSLIPKQSANARGSPEDTYAVNTHQTQPDACCSSQFPQCTACSFSPYHCSWLQEKFSARFVTWLSVPWEPPHWWKTKCNVTWQGFKNRKFGVQYNNFYS